VNGINVPENVSHRSGDNTATDILCAPNMNAWSFTFCGVKKPITLKEHGVRI